MLIKGKKDAAFELFKYAIKLKPEYPDALNNLGVLLQEKGDLEGAINLYQKAIDCYEKAIKIQPNYIAAYYNLGNLFKDIG